MRPLRRSLASLGIEFAALGIVFAALGAVVALGSPKLDAQGAYHDEIYQAPASFTWIGRPCGPFCYRPVGGIATFSMPYSGALRSAVFGIYMRLTGDAWSLPKWRLCGLLLLGAGIGVLVAAAWRRLGALPAAILFGLCVTDSWLLVLSRHDGASVPLGFLLRAVLLVVWLRSVDRGGGALGAAALGLLAGLAAWDKLHAIALVPAVGVLLAGAGWRGFARRALASTTGFAFGALPVIWAHLAYWLGTGGVWSLQGRTLIDGPSPGSIVSRLERVAAVGVAPIIHGLWLPRLQIRAERVSFLAVLVALLGVAAIGAWKWRAWSRPLATLLAAWAAVILGLLALPVATNASHWILATPFVYLALAVALRPGSIEAGGAAGGGGFARLARRGLVAVACGWLVVRLFGLASVEGILWGGAASSTLEPNYTRFARHAAAQHPDEPFLVAQWGIGNSLFCEGQGRPGWVFEVGRWSAEAFTTWLAGRDDDHVFLVGIEARWLRAGWADTERLLAALRAQPGWVESTAVGGLNAFPPMVVWRFDRREGAMISVSKGDIQQVTTGETP